MKKSICLFTVGAACALASTPLLAAPQISDTQPAFWTGPYIGGQLGLNNSSPDHGDSAVAFGISPHIGYNVAVPLAGISSPLILGGDFFMTFNTKADHGPASYGSNVFGGEALVGMPLGSQQRIMPYFKLGFGVLDGTGDLHGSSANVRFGLGAEYELQRNWGLTAEWMHEDANRISNDNFMVGVNYHFGSY